MIVCVVSHAAARFNAQYPSVNYQEFTTMDFQMNPLSHSQINQEGLCGKQNSLLPLSGVNCTHAGAMGWWRDSARFLGRADPFIYHPPFIGFARDSNSRGFARKTILIRCGQTSTDKSLHMDSF